MKPERLTELFARVTGALVSRDRQGVEQHMRVLIEEWFKAQEAATRNLSSTVDMGSLEKEIIDLEERLEEAQQPVTCFKCGEKIELY